MLSQSLRKSGRFLQQSKSAASTTGNRLNPFVSQVGFFLKYGIVANMKSGLASQSLRKSGRFLLIAHLRL